MLIKQNKEVITLESGKTRCEFLETGDIHQLIHDDILINQRLGNALDGSLNNIYLRVYNGEEVHTAPLLGIKSGSNFKYGDKVVCWYGEVLGVEYSVNFTLASENVWFWSIDLKSNDKLVDIIYGQDVSISSKGGTLTNELYMSQYIDNKIIKGDHGYVVNCRQNQPQQGKTPYLQQGSLNKEVIKYSTDGMQFFGKEYKRSNSPISLKNDLENKNYQFEFTYTAMQTEKIELNGSENITFYGVFKDDYKKAVEVIDFKEEVATSYESIDKDDTSYNLINKITLKDKFTGVLVSEEFTNEEIEKYYPNRVMEEHENDKLLSFFTKDHSHIVLQPKELLVERPHGHIISSGVSETKLNQKLISSCNFMYGVFNAQVIVGNTSFNKLLSVHRGLLNIFKNTGQRMYIKIGNEYKILTLPATYELGVNYATWYYKINNDVIKISSYTACDDTDLVLEVQSLNEVKYEYLITNQLVIGSNEFEEDINIEIKGNSVELYPQENSMLKNVHPDIRYSMAIDGVDVKFNNDEIFYSDDKARNVSMLTINTEQTNKFKVLINGSVSGDSCSKLKEYDLETEKRKFEELYNSLTCGFKLSLDSYDKNIEKINETFWWYTHNAMVHYSTPRGLEQTGGAAWGTRDVCQGPMEYFLMTQHYDLSREILIKIFENQFKETYEWPQWFMFDEYDMRQDDCHGDVIFWPLKSIGDYISLTGDYSILDESVGYKSMDKVVIEKETILQHIKGALESIKDRFLNGVALISYGGGDWDDTLQPANKELKERLVSSWTMALAYQTLKQLGDIVSHKDSLFGAELGEIAKNIKEVFDKDIIKDEIIPGFVYCNKDETFDYMLHPRDEKTGIQYRLLPMTRSIISELVDKTQAKKNIDLINEHLKCVDGVRLMNRPANYKGGTIEFFQRAEQASNVGREVGLQYVHAHIRYIEAMAKLGNANEAWYNLFNINPINIKDEVKNARRRQSNAYFSSSEGAFDTRYDFQENFDKLRNGEVEVKGGWRIYSSGPGIYLNQLVSNVLGLRIKHDSIELDPVLPIELDTLRFDYAYNTTPISIKYNIKNTDRIIKSVKVNDVEVEFDKLINSYREGGVSINKAKFEELLSDSNTIEINI